MRLYTFSSQLYRAMAHTRPSDMLHVICYMLHVTCHPILTRARPRQASIAWNGRPRENIIRENTISYPVEGQGVAVTDSDYNEILDNVFIGIDSLRFDNSTETLVLGNVLPDGVSFNLDDGATLAEGSQDPTD